MHLATILSLMPGLPVISTLIELLATPGPTNAILSTGRWFVFWGVGVRLFVAGLRQVIQPSFTAKTIFRISDPDAETLVTEIGFGNLAMGLIATLSLWVPAFLVPGALAGGLYLGLAGLKHAANKNRSRDENIAMASDLWMALVAAIAIIAYYYNA